MVIRQAKAVVLTAVVVIVVALFAWRKHVAGSRLPYHDRLSQGRADEWHAYGGTWGLRDGGVINRSDERGAKLIAGGEGWSDYQLHADVKTLGAGGDVGVLVRVTHPMTGINSYRGYYAGVQARGGALILGASNADWIAVRPIALSGGIYPGVWYHLDVVAVGCTIGAHLLNIQTRAETWSGLRDAACPRNGAIGLRSLDTGAEWKNISAEKAGESDLAAIVQHLPRLEAPTYPIREQDLAVMTGSFYGGYEKMERAILRRRSLELSSETGPRLPLTTIKALRILPPDEMVRLRGVVTLPDPLFVLDETGGGVAIQQNHQATFNVGDELEVTGQLHARGDHVFHAQSIRVLWDRTPIHAVSITSTQAASGSYEGSLVELRGDLVTTGVSPDGDYLLEIQDSSQRFSVLVPKGLNTRLPSNWKAGSLLQIRGVCLASPDRFSRNASFIVRSRSDVDVEVIAAPPWNRGVRLYILISLSCILIAAGTFAYLKLDRWRNRVVSQERERLAIEMHDTLAQSFAGLSFHLQSMRKSIQGNREVPEQLKEKLDAACLLTADTHREASDRFADLHPSTNDGDLLSQLRRYAVTMLKGGHLPIRLETSGKRKRFSFAIRQELLAIAREAMANVLQHSKATELRLTLRYQAFHAMLSIDDNGEGFLMGQQQEGFGLQGMHARANRIGGSVQIESTPGTGTCVHITVPYARRLSVVDWLIFLRARLRHNEV